MVLEGGLGSVRRERATGDEILDELVILGERRWNIEGDGVLSNEGDIGSFDGWRGCWSEEWMATFR